MSVEALAAVLHHSRAKGTAKLVLLGIANHQGDGGAWPSVATLARYANTSTRSVQRSIDALVSKGELRRELQAGGLADAADHMRPNRYDVLVQCPPWCDRSTQHRDTRNLSGRQLGLWTKGVTPVSPGDASVTPPLTPVSPEPSLEPRPQQVVPQLQDTRACAECSRVDQASCVRAQAKLQAEDRHDYSPVPRP